MPSEAEMMVGGSGSSEVVEVKSEETVMHTGSPT